MNVFALIGSIIFLVIIILCILIIIGLPLGEFTMGGKYKILPMKMRLVSISSLVLQILGLIMILQKGNIIEFNISNSVSKGFCIFFGIYLALNSIMNIMSFSKKEKYIMTPLSILSSLCFFLTAFL